MLAHLAVSLAWLLLPASLMVQHCELSRSALPGRPWTLLTCIFSPRGPWELVICLQARSWQQMLWGGAPASGCCHVPHQQLA